MLRQAQAGQLHQRHHVSSTALPTSNEIKLEEFNCIRQCHPHRHPHRCIISSFLALGANRLCASIVSSRPSNLFTSCVKNVIDSEISGSTRFTWLYGLSARTLSRSNCTALLASSRWVLEIVSNPSCVPFATSAHFRERSSVIFANASILSFGSLFGCKETPSLCRSVSSGAACRSGRGAPVLPWIEAAPMSFAISVCAMVTIAADAA